jgi:hypothetical protein
VPASDAMRINEAVDRGEQEILNAPMADEFERC